MKQIKKYIYVGIGLLSFIVGAIGVILPVLPTTPFLLLSGYCFARGSERFNTWFLNTKIYKKHLESFVKEKAMTLKQKVVILGIADTMIMIPIILINSMHLRLFLIGVIIFKFYYFIFRIKTIKIDKRVEYTNIE
ncbi:YbaN family protein [uncultured Clostridium sp.]|uniref:YbaN family protein n=1 Tax=uncultured Clostridium sp. TaxID=59620 RepID=UPI0026059307|nr:YbaN family protein [uncultured Clostridium sp.]